jgi:glycosyltransferase involved in cell wall biosynthesis
VGASRAFLIVLCKVSLVNELLDRPNGVPPSIEQPLVSVIVPTHKRLQFLKLTVRAILAQSYSALEVLVVADGDDKDVSGFLDSLRDPRVRYLACPPAGRPAVPRNFGFRHAQGEYIALCDDDDLWHPEKIRKQMDLMLKDRIGLTFTACSNIDDNGALINDHLLGDFGSVNRTKFILSLGGMIFNSSMLFTRSLLSKSGPFDEAAELRTGEDYEFCSRMLMHSDAIGIREPLVGYRTHLGSIQPQRSSDWIKMQSRIQSAILANGSASRWLWCLRYLRVFYWASRERKRTGAKPHQY